MSFITSILEQGLIYGILALGIYITYKILDFPDLTVDGSFPLGAAITAALLTRGMNPYITLILSFLAGAVAGICTLYEQNWHQKQTKAWHYLKIKHYCSDRDE